MDESLRGHPVHFSLSYRPVALAADRILHRQRECSLLLPFSIRPSMPELTPEQVKSSLTTDQYKLYRLIWERFIASQMADALMDTVSVDIDADNCLFKASGSTMKFER